MIRQLIAAVAAALLAFAPLAASAQTISYSPNTLPLSGSCGTVSVSTPCFDVSQAWSGTATFTLDRANVTADPGPSNAASLLIDRQYLGVSKFSVRRDGLITTTFGLDLSNTTITRATTVRFGANSDTILNWDAANTLALRNGVNAQVFNVYNTFTDASNYERGGFRWNGNVLQLVADQSGTGTARSFEVGTTGSNTLFLMTANVDRWAVNASGHFLANVDNTYDIGASGANRPRNAFIAGNISAGNTVTSPTFVATSYIQPGILTVGTLSTCNSGTRGARETVTDATQTFTSANFGTTVTGSGANVVPVTCDGAAWKIGQASLSPANDNLPPAYREQADRLWSAFG